MTVLLTTACSPLQYEPQRLEEARPARRTVSLELFVESRHNYDPQQGSDHYSLHTDGSEVYIHLYDRSGGAACAVQIEQRRPLSEQSYMCINRSCRINSTGEAEYLISVDCDRPAAYRLLADRTAYTALLNDAEFSGEKAAGYTPAGLVSLKTATLHRSSTALKLSLSDAASDNTCPALDALPDSRSILQLQLEQMPAVNDRLFIKAEHSRFTAPGSSLATYSLVVIDEVSSERLAGRIIFEGAGHEIRGSFNAAPCGND